MKITITYDNEAWKPGLRSDWGFSCLVEAFGSNILFDTGARGSILLGNMKNLDIDPRMIEQIMISHDHWDHTGGLSDILRINPVLVYVPFARSAVYAAGEAITVKQPTEIREYILLTGELLGIEQSLFLKTPICPAHCTQFKSEINALYPERYIKAGVGAVIQV